MYNKEYLLNIGTKEQREEYREKLGKAFERQARYLGNGVYQITGCVSNDTAELMEMFIGEQLIADKVVEYDEEKLFEED